MYYAGDGSFWAEEWMMLAHLGKLPLPGTWTR